MKSLLQQLSTASKQCFWPLIFFFIHWTSNVNVSTQITTKYMFFDSRFIYIWKFIHIQKTKLPVTITVHYIIVHSGTEEQCFPGLGSLTFKSSCFVLFLLSFLWSTANSLSATLSCTCTCFWIFLPIPAEFSRAKKPMLEGSAWTWRLNLSSLSLFLFSELSKQCAWHKQNQYN